MHAFQTALNIAFPGGTHWNMPLLLDQVTTLLVCNRNKHTVSVFVQCVKASLQMQVAQSPYSLEHGQLKVSMCAATTYIWPHCYLSKLQCIYVLHLMQSCISLLLTSCSYRFNSNHHFCCNTAATANSAGGADHCATHLHHSVEDAKCQEEYGTRCKCVYLSCMSLLSLQLNKPAYIFYRYRRWASAGTQPGFSCQQPLTTLASFSALASRLAICICDGLHVYVYLVIYILLNTIMPSDNKDGCTCAHA